MSVQDMCATFIKWVSRQSVARLFSYPRFLERELERERESRKIEAAKWEQERKALLDRILESRGVPHVHSTMPNMPVIQQDPYAGLSPRQRKIAEAQAKELAGRNGAQ